MKSASGNLALFVRSYRRWAEPLRCLFLIGTTSWLAHPYFLPRLIGTGDALWYHHLLAEAVTQFRAGVFPVFVGQSDFSFNGAVYPLRAAPYFQYFAGALDLVTGRALSFFALQHLTVVLSLFAAVFITYFSLTWITPHRRWTAAFLSLFYVLCPGVAGLFYAQDLYMSGMTLPWVPLACATIIRSFEDESPLPLVLLGISLAALWWAHSPIALWTTMIAALAQGVFLWRSRMKFLALRRAFIGAAIFSVLAVYPILSVFLIRTPGETIVPYVMNRTDLLREIGATFPASLLPLNPNAPALTHLQLGYALWIAFLMTVALWLRRRRLGVGLLISAAGFLLILIFPIPVVTRALWFSFPETLVGMTLYWPMQRLVVICAALIVVCTQRTLGDTPRSTHRTFRFVLPLLVLFAFAWSGREAMVFIRKAQAQADTVENSKRWSNVENVAIQRHTYGLFLSRPSYFTHGVVDPKLEFRLLDPITRKVIASNYDVTAARPFSEQFSGEVDANPGILNLRPAFTLQPRERYLLTFDFFRPNLSGVLQIIGPHFYREYSLPLSGEEKAFGCLPEAEKSIALWTSQTAPETIELRFIPTGPTSSVTDYIPFARYRFAPIDTSALPIKIESLIPLRAVVRSGQPAWLETPRMFVPGYVATVEGRPVPVHKSAEGLVTFPVPAGRSSVELRFVGPLALRVAFWANLTGWIACMSLLGLSFVAPKLRARFAR